MLKAKILFLILLLGSNFIYSQCNGRYQTEIFNSVNKVSVNYSDIYSDSFHEMDIYTADGDIEINRPVIIYMHGGSFYSGDKSTLDCVDFCESFAKRGYVTISLNYRLASDIISFLTSNETQYETVIEAVYDAKSAVRYLRKDFENGDNFGIDTSTIFVGGYSAGAVTAIHQAYIDDISDLPNSSINNDGSIFNIQSYASSIGGTNGFEGDAGNYGYASNISGVISFAGGINQLNWIDVNDEPLVSVQGSADPTVSYNCAPGLNNSLVLTLCGSGEMHPQADLVGINNDKLVFNGEGHQWPATGNLNPKFNQAINFTSDFLFPLLPCNTPTSTSVLKKDKKIIDIINVLGKSTDLTSNKPLFYIFSDGSVEKRIIIK